ncbi:MAG: EamA family transporter [Alistipes sp.]|jgi:drug/metabolite transporter (DMT)-like permease|nr:EamA family transporter [Alistipes sp.]
MIHTIAALVARIFANPAANVLQKQLTARGASATAVNLATYTLLAAACLIPAAGVDWGAFAPAFWWDCVAVGLLGGVGNMFLVKALERGELSVLGPVNSWKSVVGMVVGAMVLGEIPGVWGLAGMALIVGGSYLVLTVPGERLSWGLFACRDIRWRLWAMVLTAVEAVFIKRIIVASSPLTSFIVWCWFGAAASALVVLFSRHNHSLRRLRIDGIHALSPATPGFWRTMRTRGGWLRCVGVAVCVGVAQYCTNVVFRGMDVGYALALFQLSAVVSVLLGWRIFRERGIARKLLGAAVMIAGSVLVILLD